MEGQISSLNALRLRRWVLESFQSDLCDPETVNDLHSRVRRRCDAAGRLVDTLDRRLDDPARRRLVKFCLLTALNLLPLERATEESSLPALRSWSYGRQATEDQGSKQMYLDGLDVLCRLEPEFSPQFSATLGIRLSPGEQRIVREYFAIIARATGET
jgi:hypothetical protein